jgi:2-polyprenyl-6-methoxyphenol hydroxylase-like FAD-dependent oxidoreductase
VVDDPDAIAEGATETWDTKARFGFVPLPDQKIYWFACIPSVADNADYKDFGPSDLKRHFAGFHDPVSQILNRTKEGRLIHNDIYDLAPLQHFAYCKVLLVGDAAHGATPNMGQGACQAIEDAAVLFTELSKDIAIENAFLSFEQKRLARTRYVVSQSRKIGNLAHITNPVVANCRNMLLKMAPNSLKNKQFETLYNISF